ncbi:Cullin-4B [Boothiomyces macroporosus]|uniref:Cullin-4B n=1 Tax=Boothiomyces macroporosus TaxID=261099 RepID=A0AAD5Y1Q4_9FUNG|nr:Cullin-4B [Boothiomyces macroporosus]
MNIAKSKRPSSGLDQTASKRQMLKHKLVIKPFKVKPKAPDFYLEITWNTLQTAITQIQQNQENLPLEIYYQACENYCHLKEQQGLYTKLRNMMETHAQKLAAQLKKEISGNVLQTFNDYWKNYISQINVLKSVFLYLDRTFILHSKDKKSIYETGLQLFKEHVLGDMYIKESLVGAMIAEINNQRNGGPVNSLLKPLAEMFIELQVYYSMFESVFIKETVKYYENEARRYINEIIEKRDGKLVSQYLEIVLARINQESLICSEEGYLNPATQKSIISTLQTVMIDAHKTTILTHSFEYFVDNDCYEDLHRIYSFFGETKNLDYLKTHLSEYIQKIGDPIVQDPSKDSEMIQSLLDFQEKINTIIVSGFDDNPTFALAAKESFGAFVNKRKMKPAELVALFIDKLLKTGKITEEEVERKLNQCLSLFRLIQGKDVFEAFYGKHLAKRLLLGKSASVDSEKSMLVKLKSECGAGFTQKLEGMFKDVDLSTDLMKSFMSSKYASRLSDMELHVHVLTFSYWPTYPIHLINIPEEFANDQQVFNEFYTSKYKGRRLAWPMSLGHCVLHYQHPNGNKDLIVSLYQAVILLLFNKYTQLTTSEIVSLLVPEEENALPKEELFRALQSISVAKIKILKKNPYTKDISLADKWTINLDFSHPKHRVVINTIQAQETEQENQKTTEQLFEDRQWQVDAAIVRIMKGKKKCSFKTLVTELFEMLKFPVETADLKKRIESLIERDYMERDPNDPSVYLYLA